MKTVIMIAITMLLGYVVISNFILRASPNKGQNQQIAIFNGKAKQPLRIVFDQDVSQSNLRNGVELISSSIFIPLFEEVDRAIEINFGCISKSSAGKLITVNLPAAIFKRPEVPDVHNISITEKKRLKEEYENKLGSYKSDSAKFFTDRTYRISAFCHSVDSMLSLYRKKLSPGTDILTAVNVADRVFGFSGDDLAKNFLILNSDGQDSYGHIVKKMRNRAIVILANAGRDSRTSIDQIITKQLESPEQAIHYILNN